MSRKKNVIETDVEYNSIISEDGKVVKVEVKEEPKKPSDVEYDKDEKVTMFKEIKLGTFKTKSHFLAIILSAFGGLLAIHDFYLGLNRRGFFKFGLLGISVITSAILFTMVSAEVALAFNMFFQMIMLLPLLLYVLWWSYDFVTVATKSSKRFKQKPKTLCQHEFKKKKNGTYVCKKCGQVFDSNPNELQ